TGDHFSTDREDPAPALSVRWHSRGMTILRTPALVLLAAAALITGLSSSVSDTGIETRPAPAAGSTAATLWVSPTGALEVTGPYRAPPHRYGSGHRGIDLAAAPGATVAAPAAGTVSFTGTVV